MHLAFVAAYYFEQEMTGNDGEAESSDSGHTYFARALLARKADISKQDNVRSQGCSYIVTTLLDNVHYVVWKNSFT